MEAESDGFFGDLAPQGFASSCYSGPWGFLKTFDYSQNKLIFLQASLEQFQLMSTFLLFLLPNSKKCVF